MYQQIKKLEVKNEVNRNDLNRKHFFKHNFQLKGKLKQKLTNLLELLFRTVLAFPKASNRGFDSKITSLTFCTFSPPPETFAI